MVDLHNYFLLIICIFTTPSPLPAALGARYVSNNFICAPVCIAIEQGRSIFPYSCTGHPSANRFIGLMTYFLRVPACIRQSASGTSMPQRRTVFISYYAFSTPKCRNSISSASFDQSPLLRLQHSSSSLKNGSFSPSFPKSSMAVIGILN